MFNTSGNSGYSLSDIAAATNNNNRNDDWGGNGSWWIIILFLFCFMGGGWNNNDRRNDYGSCANSFIPMYQGNTTRDEISQAFDMNDLQSGIRGIQQGLCDGFYAQNSSLMQGFSNTDAQISGLNNNFNNAICSLGYNIQQGQNDTNLAILNSQYAQSIAAMQNQNALQTQIAECCCQNTSNQKDLMYQMATNTCSVNTNNNNNTRDIVDAQNANTRAILEAIQQNKIEAMQDKIAGLSAQNNLLAFQASQQAQNAYLLNQLKPCPIPAYITCSPYQTYTYGNGCNCVNSCGC